MYSSRYAKNLLYSFFNPKKDIGIVFKQVSYSPMLEISFCFVFKGLSPSCLFQG